MTAFKRRRMTSKSAPLSATEIKRIADEAAQRSIAATSQKEARQQAVLIGIASGYSATKAAKSAGVTRQCVWNWRKEDEAFEIAFLDAIEQVKDNVVDIIHERATRLAEPSDLLLMFYAKALMPQFKESHKVEHTHKTEGIPFNVQMDMIEAKLRERWQAKLDAKRLEDERDATPGQRLIDITPAKTPTKKGEPDDDGNGGG